MRRIQILPMILVLFGASYPHVAQATDDQCTPHCMCLHPSVDVALEGVVEAESDLGRFEMRVTAVHLRDGVGAEQAPAVGDVVDAYYFMGVSVGDRVLASSEPGETGGWGAIPMIDEATFSCRYDPDFTISRDEVIAAWFSGDCYQAAGDLGLRVCRYGSGEGCSVAPQRSLPAGGSLLLLLLVAGFLLLARRYAPARHG